MAKYTDDLTGKATRHDREYLSYEEIEGKVAKRVGIKQASGDKVDIIDVSPFGKFDKITVAYPINTREVYTYSLDGSDIGSVIVDYTSASKKLLSVVSYNVI